MALYKDWDQFEKPSKIRVYLNNGKTLEINPSKIKGGKKVYDAILQAFIDDRFDITDKVIQGMTDNLSEAKATLCGRCGHVHVKGTPCPRPFKEGAKPDFLDIDKDGNKTEPMKKAAKDAKINEAYSDASKNQLASYIGTLQNQINAEKDPKKLAILKQDLADVKAELEKKSSGSSKMKHEVVSKIMNKLKEVDVDPTAGSVVVSKTTSPADIKKYTTQGIDVQLKEVYDFFEDNMDDDAYVDVSGQSVEMYMEELLMEFEDRLKEIPEESRQAGLRAIKTFWINMIKDWNPDLTTPHRAPVTESKHPIFEVKEYDYEGQMAKSQLVSIVKNAKSLFDSISDKTQLQAWVQSKLTKAEDYLSAVARYLEGESISNTAPLMVNNEPAKDDEGTTLNVGDVVRAADGGIYQAIHSYSEGKPFLTPFDLKKRKTINLRDRHYFDNVNEDGMSITKKMYKVMSHNQTKGGFIK